MGRTEQGTQSRELAVSGCPAQRFCASLCKAGTLNDNDSGYTLRENAFEPRVGHSSDS